MTEDKLQSLNDIFNECIFRIPDFQRGYSWELSNLEDFWEDLKILKEDRVHYTGVLTVQALQKSQVETMDVWKDDLWLFDGGVKAYYLIDGQQRLTTAIILVNEILKMVKEDILLKSKKDWINKFLYRSYKDIYKSYIFGYEKDNPSYEYFKTKILNQTSFLANKEPEITLYTKNLERAKFFFARKLKELSAAEIGKIFKKLITSFKFNVYEIDKELDVYVAFETMNNRGKSLSNLELLKNRLIYLSTLLEDKKESDSLRRDVNEVWKTIYEYMGKKTNKKLDDDTFLKDHWIMFFGYERDKAEAYAKFLLNEYFTTKRVLNHEIGLKEINDYILSLQESAKFWTYIKEPKYCYFSDDTKEWLAKLNRLEITFFTPLLMAVLQKYGEEEFLPLIKKIERFIFLVFKISQRRSTTGNNRVYAYASELFHDKISLEDLHVYIDALSNTFIALPRFTDHVNDLYKTSSSVGFYGWKGLKYLLYEYELYLQDKVNGDLKVFWDIMDKRVIGQTIEHIYPQNPVDESWERDVESYACDWYDFKKYPSNEKKFRLLNSLGNLLLLKQSKNSELQNKPFAQKKCHKNKKGADNGYFNGSYSEIEISKNENWTALDIYERGKRMLEFIEKRWDISFEEQGFDVDKTLGLDFVKEEIEGLG